MISDATFKKFQEAVKKEYGQDLTDKDAREILTGMVNYFDLLAKIHHRSEMAKKEQAVSGEEIKKEDANNQTNQE